MNSKGPGQSCDLTSHTVLPSCSKASSLFHLGALWFNLLDPGWRPSSPPWAGSRVRNHQRVEQSLTHRCRGRRFYFPSPFHQLSFCFFKLRKWASLEFVCFPRIQLFRWQPASPTSPGNTDTSFIANKILQTAQWRVLTWHWFFFQRSPCSHRPESGGPT